MTDSKLRVDCAKQPTNIISAKINYISALSAVGRNDLIDEELDSIKNMLMSASVSDTFYYYIFLSAGAIDRHDYEMAESNIALAENELVSPRLSARQKKTCASELKRFRAIFNLYKAINNQGDFPEADEAFLYIPNKHNHLYINVANRLSEALICKLRGNTDLMTEHCDFIICNAPNLNFAVIAEKLKRGEQI